MISLAHWSVEAFCNGEAFDYQAESQDQYYFEYVYAEYAATQAKLDEASA